MILRGFLEGKWMKVPLSYEEKGGCPNLFKGLVLECWTCCDLFMIVYFDKIFLGYYSGSGGNQNAHKINVSLLNHIEP